MSLSVDCGTDLYGTKVNVKLTFNSMPALAELAAAAESQFDTKARANRPAGYPDTPFRIETFQVFDDTLLRWVDLYDGRQLRTGSQLWCFQPESIWHSDAQGVIPEPEKPIATFTTPLGSPRRARIANDAGVPPTLSEKLRSVFFQIDGQNKGYLLHQDLESAFRKCEMDFTHSTAGDLFTMADQNRSNHITYDEWVNFAIKAPGLIDALFFRMRDMFQDRMPQSSPPSHDAQLARQQELQSMYRQQQDADQRARQEEEYRRAKQQDADRARQQQEADQRARQEEEYRRARDQQRLSQEQAMAAQNAAQDAANKKAMAQQRAEELAAKQRAAEDAAAQAAQQLAAAQAAASQAADQHNHAVSDANRAAQQQAEAEQRAASVRAASPPLVASPGYHSPPAASTPGAYGTGNTTSPERDNALREYERARRKADEVRLAKEEAEREERNAWDRCYYAPGSPHYNPGSRGY